MVFLNAAWPSFLSLYPAYEKTHNIRALQYASGVKPLSLWASHVVFDLITVVLAAAATTATISVQFQAFVFHADYLFLVILLYGLAAILVTYLMGRVARNQLSAFLYSFGVLILLFGIAALAFGVRNERLCSLSS
jgi:ATP-binding cassette, subfamily A (ABC1), member 3